jgi:hypothetical protein
MRHLLAQGPWHLLKRPHVSQDGICQAKAPEPTYKTRCGAYRLRRNFLSDAGPLCSKCADSLQSAIGRAGRARQGRGKRTLDKAG